MMMMMNSLPFRYNADEVSPGVYDCRVLIPASGLIIEHIRIEALGERDCEAQLVTYVARQVEQMANPPKHKRN